MRATLLALTLTIAGGFATALPAAAQFSSGTGNTTNCSPGATNKGCSFGGGEAHPGTGNTTSQTNTGSGGNRSDTTHTTQQPGSNRGGAETGMGNSATGR